MWIKTLVLINFLNGIAATDPPRELVSRFQETKVKTVELYSEFVKYDKFRYWAINESAKLFYASSNWEHFFGVIEYLKVTGSELSQNLQELEVLALIRHCRFDEAFERIKPQEKHPLHNLYTVWKSLDQSVLKSNSKSESRESRIWRSNDWPLSSKAIAKLDPLKLKVKMVSMCKSGGGL